jgi:hypothetical protein
MKILNPFIKARETHWNMFPALSKSTSQMSDNVFVIIEQIFQQVRISMFIFQSFDIRVITEDVKSSDVQFVLKMTGNRDTQIN